MLLLATTAPPDLRRVWLHPLASAGSSTNQMVEHDVEYNLHQLGGIRMTLWSETDARRP